MSDEHGPLPALLGLLTLVTCFVDAVTYLKFGHVFVANMTGNIIFLGFGFAGVEDIYIVGTLLALIAFLFGALVGGRLTARLAAHRGRMLSYTAIVKTLLLASAATIASLGGPPVAIIPFLGITMGLQNAVVRKLAVAEITTTVLTLTLTGLMADSKLAGGTSPRAGRRIAMVIIMFAGALAGAACVLRGGTPFALWVATAIVAVVCASSYVLGRTNPPWVFTNTPHPSKPPERASAP